MAQYSGIFTLVQQMQAKAASNWPVAPYFTATGGTITTVGNYKVHTFTSSGTFAVTAAPAGAIVEVMCVAGGGGGGNDNAGGGGAGGLVFNSAYSVSAGDSITVTIGSGGAGATSSGQRGASGNNSVFGSIDRKSTRLNSSH